MKKGKILTLVGALTFILLPNYVKASEIEVCSSCDITSINEAFTSASDGDIIKLKNESYTLEDITINKNITIIGENKDNSIIKLGKTVTDWITVASGKKLTLKSITLDGNKNSYQVNNAIKVLGSLDVQDTIFTNLGSSNNTSVGIYSSGESDAGEINVKNVSMNNIEYAGIKLANSTKNVKTVIDNFTYVGRGTINEYRQYGIVIEDGRSAQISNANISGCLNDGDDLGNASAAIWVHGDPTVIPERLVCHEELLESYTTFTSPRCSEITKVYIETSDLTNNTVSLYIGREEQDDANVVVRYSKLNKIFIRGKSYLDVLYNYWNGLTSLLDIISQIVVDSSSGDNPVMIHNIYTDGFYTSASAAISKSPILDFSLKQDNVEFSIGKSYLLDDYVNVKQNMFNDVTLDTPSATEDFRLHVWDYVKATPKDSNVLTVDNKTGQINTLVEGMSTIKVDVTGFNSLVIGANVLSGNPQTSDLPVIIVCFVGLIALGYGIYKLNKSKYDY